MTGQSWFGAVGWRHIVAIMACVFAIIPVLFVTSAAINPLGTLSSTSLIPKEFGHLELRGTSSTRRHSPTGSSTRS